MQTTYNSRRFLKKQYLHSFFFKENKTGNNTLVEDENCGYLVPDENCGYLNPVIQDIGKLKSKRKFSLRDLSTTLGTFTHIISLDFMGTVLWYLSLALAKCGGSCNCNWLHYLHSQLTCYPH